MNASSAGEKGRKRYQPLADLLSEKSGLQWQVVQVKNPYDESVAYGLKFRHNISDITAPVIGNLNRTKELLNKALKPFMRHNDKGFVNLHGNVCIMAPEFQGIVANDDNAMLWAALKPTFERIAEIFPPRIPGTIVRPAPVAKGPDTEKYLHLAQKMSEYTGVKWQVLYQQSKRKNISDSYTVSWVPGDLDNSPETKLALTRSCLLLNQSIKDMHELEHGGFNGGKGDGIHIRADHMLGMETKHRHAFWLPLRLTGQLLFSFLPPDAQGNKRRPSEGFGQGPA